jgi:Rha family phage regulatory protein
MNELVFIENGQAVTDSLTVAEVFGKRHDRVLQDIRSMGCSENFRVHNFVESSYVNKQNKTMPKYFMNKKAFDLLVMGYTGSEAMKYKEAYIEEFYRMEEEMKGPKVLTEKEKLIASMKLSLETAEEVTVMKNDIQLIKHQVSEELTLNHGQQQTLHHSIKKRVESIFQDYEELTKREVYAQIHSHLRRAFSAPKYIFVKRKDYDEALAWVKSWRPLI